MKRKLLFRALFVAWVVVAEAYAQPGVADIEVVTERTPLTDLPTSGVEGGETTVFVRELLEEAGLSFSLNYLPWRRAYQRASTNRNTLVFPLAISPARRDKFHWVGELIPVNYYLFKLRGRTDISLSSLEEAADYRIGVVNYHVHHEYLLQEGISGLQPVNSNAQNLRKVLLGRIDLVALSDGGIVALCDDLDIDCEQFEPVYHLAEISGGLYMAFNMETEPALIKRVQDSYQVLRDSGRHREIFKQRLAYIADFEEVFLRSRNHPETEVVQ